VVDFEKLEEFSDAFKDSDAGFCCLGTNYVQTGKVRINYFNLVQLSIT